MHDAVRVVESLPHPAMHRAQEYVDWNTYNVANGGRPPYKGINPLRGISALLAGLSLASVGALVLTDVMHEFRSSAIHQRMSAYPLLLVGLSYMVLQSADRRRRPAEIIQALFLGLAFVMWGSEQLFPRTALVTTTDCAVVTIFVVDMAWIVVQRLCLADRISPPPSVQKARLPDS